MLKLLENCNFSPKGWLLTWGWNFAICGILPVFHEGCRYVLQTIGSVDKLERLLFPETVLNWFSCFIWDVCGGLWNALNWATC